MLSSTLSFSRPVLGPTFQGRAKLTLNTPAQKEAAKAMITALGNNDPQNHVGGAIFPIGVLETSRHLTTAPTEPHKVPQKEDYHHALRFLLQIKAIEPDASNTRRKPALDEGYHFPKTFTGHYGEQTNDTEEELAQTAKALLSKLDLLG